MTLSAQQTLALPAMTTAAAAGGGTDYKALVIFAMVGGNDAHNTVIPTESTAYTSYAAGKQSLALANSVGASAGQLRALTGTTRALHPSLSGIANLYNTGDCAILANVGPLVVPITKAQWNNQRPTVAVPFNLFSHNDQLDIWCTARPDTQSPTGWAGRIADLLQGAFNPGQLIPLCTSVSGNTIALTGNDSRQYQVGLTDAITLTRETFATAAINPGSHTNLLEIELENNFVSARDSAAAVNTNIGADPNVANPGRFPTSSLGNQLKMIARMIAGRGTASTGLRQRRQVFYCSQGGFDQHGAGSLTAHASSLTSIDAAVVAFQAEMATLGLTDNVTLATISDFGRAQLLNGQGTDHGWGGHHFVIGGAVNGGAIYGTWADPVIGGPQDAGQGRLIPTTSVHQYAATLARWMGIPDALSNGVNPIDVTFPGLTNFSTRNLGFLP